MTQSVARRTLTPLLFALFATSLLAASGMAEVVINEILASNRGGHQDAYGEHPDWIELYNRGDVQVDLAGYGLSDDPERPFRWVFPELTLEPGEHLLIFASGRNIPEDADGLTHGVLREVYHDIEGGLVADLLDAPKYPDHPDERHLIATGFAAPSNVGIHYGQRMQAYLAPPQSGYYRFWIASDDEGHLYLSSDEKPENVSRIAVVPGWTQPLEWTRFPEQESAPVYLEAGSLYYILALQKEHEGGDNLAVRWQMPDGVTEGPIHTDHLFWEVTEHHTNFSIAAEGEALLLSRPDGTVVDSVPPTPLPANVSYGRSPDGADAWHYFDVPTPGNSNNDATAYQGISPAPEFSQGSGFYTQPLAVSLQTDASDTAIYYSLDGSIPDALNLDGSSYAYKNDYPDGPMLQRHYQSHAYASPIAIQRRPSGTDGLEYINTTSGAPRERPETWTIDGETLYQQSLEPNVRHFFGDQGWRDYEFRLQARKEEGDEGFLVFFRARGHRLYWLNLGGWGNTRHAIQKDGGNILDGLEITGEQLIEEDRWYDIRVRCEGNRFQCWLDDELLFDFTDPEVLQVGQVGLGAWQTRAHFRNLEVRQLDDDAVLFSGLPNLAPYDGAATVLRARSYREGYLPSHVVTHTYFVDPDITTRFDLPVAHLTVAEPDFFGYEAGIYVPGQRYVTHHNEHYFNRGSNWERPAHLTFFETDGAVGLNMDLGVRIHGGATRGAPLKSLRLYARGAYGSDSIDYPIFPEAPDAEYRRLLLRNSGNDQPYTMFRDAMLQRVMQGLRFETQAYRPAVVFINGAYWGIQNLRERYDKHFIARKYGVEETDLDLLSFLLSAPHSAIEGDDRHYVKTLNYLSVHDMADPGHYAHIQTRIDIENFIDYYIAQIFIANTDWPGNNNDFWRKRTESYEADAPHGHDGRWRWLLYDTDFGAGLSGQHNHDTLRFAMEPDGPNWPNPPWATEIFRALLDNPNFRQDFVIRFCDLINTQFQPERIIAIIDEMQAALEHEIPHHIARWQQPNAISTWRYQVNVMRNFAQNRPDHVRYLLRDYFQLGEARWVNLHVADAAQGDVRINTATLSGNGGESLDWQGMYFEGMPLDIEAVARPGYRFSHWEGLPLGTPQKTSFPIEGQQDITAHFEAVHLLHYWHFNHLADSRHGTVPADYSFSGDALISYPGTGGGYMDMVDEGSTLNAWMSEAAGNALRVRNPSDSRELLLELPTTGFRDIGLQYAFMRTPNGAQTQQVYYRLGVDEDWIPIGDTVHVTEEFARVAYDFSGIEGVDDNPNFAVRIRFLGPETTGEQGNNRFDNISLTGMPMESTTPPPALIAPVGLQHGIENGEAVRIDLGTVFENPGDSPLMYQAESDNPFVSDTQLEGNTLHLHPLQRGDTWITVTVDDGENQPLSHSFRLLVHPEPVPLRQRSFNFNYWAADAPQRVYPEHMLFLQSEVTDPGLNIPLPHPYFISMEEYHEDDSHTVGQPYNNTRRTRLNGLNEDGISFINTGWERDLGGAMVAVDSTEIDELVLHWAPGTVLENERRYGLRLQYRTAPDEDFADVLVDGAPIAYEVQEDGHQERHGPIILPEALLDQPYLQLLWRYHHIEGDNGPRAELQLRHFMLGDQAQMHHSADLEQRGNIDLHDVLRVVQLYNAGGYHCAAPEAMSEDGFEPGVDPTMQDCLPHDADFDPQDWEIGLNDLLRIIQLYNSPGYYRCQDSVDGFCFTRPMK